MSQRVKRPNRSDDGSVPAKRRKVSTHFIYLTLYRNKTQSDIFNNESLELFCCIAKTSVTDKCNVKSEKL